MACFHPLKAFKTDSGQICFQELKKHGGIAQALELPCGQCIGCRLERSRQWAMRCTHEAQQHAVNSFITATYNDENLPERGQLVYAHWQSFMRRLRKQTGKKIRFFVSGEYGETTERPHYHAIIFGHHWHDQTPLSQLGEQKYFRSEILNRQWQKGNCVIGAVTFESAAYVARYCLKKITGPGADEHYKRTDEKGDYEKTREFAHMSLKPGIGKTWLDQYKTDIYPNDYVVVKGQKMKPPKYYDKKHKEEEPENAEWLEYERTKKAETQLWNNEEKRLQVRETVAKAKIKTTLKRDKV